jgi:hypothetical protein
MPTEEQKERKNEMRRLNRARKKEVISKEEPKEEPNEPIEEPQEPQEDPEAIRKRAIADKRRASLALARSKIKLNLQITKEKDVELTKIKEENLQLKELANKKEEVHEIVKKPVKMYNTPIKQRPKKEEVYQQPQQEQQKPSIDYLVDKSYGEKLQTRLRDNMLQRMMQDTFM